MIWRHSGERSPPPMPRTAVSLTPVASSMACSERDISMQIASRSERYIEPFPWVPRQPTIAPRATGSQ